LRKNKPALRGRLPITYFKCTLKKYTPKITPGNPATIAPAFRSVGFASPPFGEFALVRKYVVTIY